MKKTLSIRTPEAGERPAPKSWGLTGERLERLKTRAREERRHPTEGELKLWDHLRGGQIGGLKFNRKAIVGSVLVDFACGLSLSSRPAFSFRVDAMRGTMNTSECMISPWLPNPSS